VKLQGTEIGQLHEVVFFMFLSPGSAEVVSFFNAKTAKRKIGSEMK
jgi:hypothetical protein